jgi:hypothetical protein
VYYQALQEVYQLTLPNGHVICINPTSIRRPIKHGKESRLRTSTPVVGFTSGAFVLALPRAGC